MKVVFVNIPMKKQLNKHFYINQDTQICYENEVVYPINAILAQQLHSNDEVKVVMLSKEGGEKQADNNIQVFKQELDLINSKIGAKIEYRVLSSLFVETREVQEGLMRSMLSELEDHCEIYSDITYGPKSLPIIQFAVMNFAEKFFDAKIINILYGKVDFIDDGTGSGNTKSSNPVICDMTSLYYLNSLTNSMDYNGSKEAMQALDILLNI